MLRLKILASTLPLILAAVLARGEFVPVRQPCIAIGATAVQLATAPWQAAVNVAFTDIPARATVRVQIVDTPEIADFTVVDDVDESSGAGCGGMPTTRLIGITSETAAAGLVIYLSRDADADYRIYVRSKDVTARDAAALIVGASGGHGPITHAAL